MLALKAAILLISLLATHSSSTLVAETRPATALLDDGAKTPAKKPVLVGPLPEIFLKGKTEREKRLLQGVFKMTKIAAGLNSEAKKMGLPGTSRQLHFDQANKLDLNNLRPQQLVNVMSILAPEKLAGLKKAKYQYKVADNTNESEKRMIRTFLAWISYSKELHKQIHDEEAREKLSGY